ncbi:MarR family transcriptional regulator [Nocardioides sp. zg-536]|uniref:MarR family transcriptional regulator n=1 Tax=Nocardioides faecalis TaxID=2803858 RepID=A0A938Y9B1_9ACTN|nr:MarR family transcriptional regulator [Nocardioides faecalis]MBM9461557.1 MarR family transcriptional regulator [Nocardioides faecalis]MBS4752533.1 MarR family transcriptional regulator [Nocardioides faecalis]QVI57809.1 MarR family transcriptional regulator [Nocardioides faecalis]
MTDSDVDVTEAWRALVEAHDRLIRVFEAHLKDRYGLTKAKFDILRRLLEAEGHRARTQELAQALFYSSGSATKVIDRLVERGLVNRSAHDTDRRVVFVSLTPAGLALAREVVEEHRALIHKSLARFESAAEANHVLAYLHRLAEGS